MTRTSRGVFTVSGAALLATLLAAMPAAAHHTIFLFRADRVEIDGNAHGPHDGSPDFIDEFDDGDLAPTFYRAYGTALESGGFAVLTNPGFHFPSPFGGLTDVSIAASWERVWGGSGDFTATSYWAPDVPPPGKSFHFTLFPTTTLSGFHQVIGIGIADRDGGLKVEQHRTDVNQSTGAFQNTVVDFLPISPAELTGSIGLRLLFDDSTRIVTTAYSLDGGATLLSPFSSFALRTMATANAQLLLSADPEVAGSGTTTTTIATGTTTTTTLVDGTCSAIGCIRGFEPMASQLVIKDKATDKGDSLAWKLKRGARSTLEDFGDPTNDTSYTFCLSDGAGTVLMQATIPAAPICAGAPCWNRTAKGPKFTDPGKTFGGLRKILLREGPDGYAQILVKARGENLDPPMLPLLTTPITARLEASTGACWATVFGGAGIRSNIPAQFKAKGE